MNKLELIDALKDECRISRKEAAAVVDLFSAILRRLLQGVTGLKFADYALSMLKNINPTEAGTPKPAKAFR